MAESFDKPLEWDDEIEKESEFTLLPEGDYKFTVTGFERARHPGSEKLPPCQKAVVSIKVESPEGSTTIKHQLFLHTKCEGILCEFFNGIGQKKHGEKLKMNWQTVIGSTGRCKVYIDNYTRNDGTEGQSNKIKKFYDPSESDGQASTPQSKFTPGKF